MTKPSRTFQRSVALAILPLLAASAWALAGWTDRKEYDLVLKIRVEASPQKQLELLNQWQQQYPKSEMRQVRRELFLSAYQATGDNAKIFETAREMLADQPNSFVGAYWCALLLPEMRDAKPEALAAGDKAAHQLVTGLDGYFSPAQKPKAMADADWQKQKAAAELLAHRAIGWGELQRGDYAAAEKTFTGYLQKNPKSVEVTSWLGYAIAYQKRQIPAAWQLARAAAMPNDGSLPEAYRRQIDDLAERLYVAYHGEVEGLDKLKAGAAANPVPPADFQVESAEVIRQRKAEEELNRVDPELGAWLGMYKHLTAADGEKYFVESLKPSPLPRLRGTVIRCEPPDKPKQIVLGLSSADAEEVVLKLSVPFGYPAEAGTPLQFQGAADTFVKEPFRLTVLADQENVVGWPDPPAKKKK